MILHNYFRSSTSIRVRVALNLKNISYEYASYALLDEQHKSDEYLELNPQGLVPALQMGPKKSKNGSVMSQSLAIIEYLDEVHPQPPLLPKDSWARGQVRSLAMIIACDIHPINNLSVLKTLREQHGADDAQVRTWFCQWVHNGFTAFEQRLADDQSRGRFCYGDEPGLADICLYAQMINNQRFDVDVSAYPLMTEIFERCLAIEAFERAHPKHQPDAF